MKKCNFLAPIFLFSFFAYGQIPTSGLVAYYPFTNGSLADASGNGNNATNYGATLTTDHLGNPNSAYYFNGSTAYIQVANSSSLSFSNDSITIAFWAKVEAFPSGSYASILISKQSGSGNTQSGFNVNQGNQTAINFLVSAGGGNFGGGNVPSNSSNYNVFHNIVMTFGSGKYYAYLDGVLADSGQGSASIGANTVPLLFGKANWSNVNAAPFTGVLDGIALYNQVLNQQQVTQIYTSSACTHIDTVTVYDTISTHVTVYDTTHVTVHDTTYTSIAVTDTLYINAHLTGIAPPNNINELRVYPNPAKTDLYIDCGNYANMSGYNIKVRNSIGQVVYSTAITQQQYAINLSTWSGHGIYILTIYDPSNTVIATKEIVIQ